MAVDAAEVLTRAATAVHTAARAHKRAEFQHRKQARELMATLAQLREACLEHGIELEINGEAERGKANGQGTARHLDDR